MATTFFPALHGVFPPSKKREACTKSALKKFEKKLPAELINEWKEFGFGAYGDGILWLTNPDDEIITIEDWPGVADDAIVVLYTAFADILLWQKKTFYWLNVYAGSSVKFTNNAGVMFDSALRRDDFRKEVLLEKMFKYAHKKFGALNSGECYGFAPLPSLGGAMEKEYIIKTKLKEHLSFIGQSH